MMCEQPFASAEESDFEAKKFLKTVKIQIVRLLQTKQQFSPRSLGYATNYIKNRFQQATESF